MSLFGNFEHHLQIAVGDEISPIDPNSWVMLNWDIYQLLSNVIFQRWGFPEMGVPVKWMVDFMENPMELDDLRQSSSMLDWDVPP